MSEAFPESLYSPEAAALAEAAAPEKKEKDKEEDQPSAEEEKEPETVPFTIPAEVQTELTELESFSVAEMICSVARTSLVEATKDREDIQALAAQMDMGASEFGTCTEVGLSVAEGLVRNASTRIFDDPNQSIMELISNGVDAIPGARPEGGNVGKFGFGVFSNFHWLYNEKNPNARVAVITTTKTEQSVLVLSVEPNERDKSGYSLRARMMHKTGDFDKTGTSFTVFIGEGAREMISTMRMQSFIDRFAYFPDTVNIWHGNRLVNTVADPAKRKSNKNVRVQLTNRLFSVADEGVGMSRNTLFRYFLVPSVSSKSEGSSLKKSAVRAADVKPERILLETKPGTARFTIVVAGVAVVNLKLPKQPNAELTLFFPPEMPVTIARNDIQISAEQAKALARDVVDAGLDLLDNPAVMPWLKNIQVLQIAADAYVDASPSQHALVFRDAVQEFLRQAIESGKYQIVNSSLRPFLQQAYQYYSIELGDFAIFDDISPIPGELELCKRIQAKVTDTRLESFNSSTINVLMTPDNAELKDWGLSIIHLPFNEKLLGVDRGILLDTVRAARRGVLIINETHTRADKTFKLVTMELLRRYFPRFRIYRGDEGAESMFSQALNFTAQFLGMDREYGPGNLREKLTGSMLVGSRAHCISYLTGGLLGFAEMYCDWPGHPSLSEDAKGMFARIAGKLSADLSNRDEMLLAATYTTEPRFKTGSGMNSGLPDNWQNPTPSPATFQASPDAGVDDFYSQGRWMPRVDLKGDWARSMMALTAAEYESLNKGSSLDSFSTILPVPEIHSAWMGLRRGADFTRRFFRHLEDICTTVSVRRFRTNRVGVTVFDCGGMLLETLFLELASVVMGLVFYAKMGEYTMKHIAAARAVFHMLSMGARSGSELVVMLLAFINLGQTKTWASRHDAAFIEEFCGAIVQAFRMTFTSAELASALWADMSPIHRSAYPNMFHIQVTRTNWPLEQFLTYDNPIKQALELVNDLYTLRLKSTSHFPLYRKPKMPEGGKTSFDLGSLISYMFFMPFEGMKTIENARRMMIPALPFNITSIAINEGTSKEITSAMLTEMAQNSIDAVRTSRESDAYSQGINIYVGYHFPETQWDRDPKLKGIEAPSDHFNSSARRARPDSWNFKPGQQRPALRSGERISAYRKKRRRLHKAGLRPEKTFEEMWEEMATKPAGESELDSEVKEAPAVETSKDDAALVVEVDDAVGIPTGALPALFIPYLSSKDPRKGETTGEMGNGLFTAYREAELVVFHTRSDRTADKATGPIRIFDTPFRDASDRVSGLEKDVERLPEDARAGTAITIFMKPEKTSYTSRLVQIQAYVRERFSMLRDVPVFLNGQRVNPSSDIFHGDSVSTKCVEFAMLKDTKKVTQVTTKGIPFRPLSTMYGSIQMQPWQYEILKTGVVVDLRKPVTCYTPVQSRTSVNLTDQAIEDFESSTLQACWLRTAMEALEIMDKQGVKNEELNSFLSDMTSKADIRQIVPRQAVGERSYNNRNFGTAPVPKQALLMYYKASANDTSVAEIIGATTNVAKLLPSMTKTNEDGDEVELDESEYPDRLVSSIIGVRYEYGKSPWQLFRKARLAVAWVLNKENATVLMRDQAAKDEEKRLLAEKKREEELRKAKKGKFKPKAQKVGGVKLDLTGLGNLKAGAKLKVKEAVPYFPHWHNKPQALVDEYKGKVEALVRPFAQAYFNIASSEGLKLIPKAHFKGIEVVCDAMKANGGWYHPSSSKITVNLAALNREEIDQFDAVMRDPDYSNGDIENLITGASSKLPSKLFSSRGLVAHEMEHARRRTAHRTAKDETHGPDNTLPDAGSLEFNDCMAFVYKKVDMKILTIIKQYLTAFRTDNSIEVQAKDRPVNTI